MNAIFRSSAVLSAVLLAAATYSHAATVNVPFAFQANGIALPAGSYDVNLDARHNYIVVSSKEYAAKQFTAFVTRTQPNAQGPMVLSFDNSGPVAVLRQIRDTGWSTPNLAASHKGDKAAAEKRLRGE